MAYDFVRLLVDDGSWNAFEADWKAQCADLDEDFDNYAGLTLDVVKDIIVKREQKAAVFALKLDDKHIAMCQVNCAPIPKYVGPVLRTRFITFSPEYDLTDDHVAHYPRALVELLFGVIKLGIFDGEFASRHVKLHLRSPEDSKFFTAIGHGLSEHELFERVATIGQWLYVTRK